MHFSSMTIFALAGFFSAILATHPSDNDNRPGNCDYGSCDQRSSTKKYYKIEGFCKSTNKGTFNLVDYNNEKCLSPTKQSQTNIVTYFEHDSSNGSTRVIINDVAYDIYIHKDNSTFVYVQNTRKAPANCERAKFRIGPNRGNGGATINDEKTIILVWKEVAIVIYICKSENQSSQTQPLEILYPGVPGVDGKYKNNPACELLTLSVTFYDRIVSTSKI